MVLTFVWAVGGIWGVVKAARGTVGSEGTVAGDARGREPLGYSPRAVVPVSRQFPGGSRVPSYSGVDERCGVVSIVNSATYAHGPIKQYPRHANKKVSIVRIVVYSRRVSAGGPGIPVC